LSAANRKPIANSKIASISKTTLTNLRILKPVACPDGRNNNKLSRDRLVAKTYLIEEFFGVKQKPKN